MNIREVGMIGSDYFYSPSTRKKAFADAVAESAEETALDVQKRNVSPEEIYKGFSSDRQQKAQELGLEYIDASNCTWEEFRSLCRQVSEMTEYDACPLEELSITVGDEGVEMNCLDYLRRWSEEQMEKGNMVEFHMGKKLSGAIANYSMDIRGENKVLEVNGEQFQGRVMEEGTSLKPNFLGSAFAFEEWGTVPFDAMYAADSTTDNPIVEIHMYGRDGLPQVYRVVLSEVNMRDATQLEMFALCAHKDRQAGNSAQGIGDNSYLTGKTLGIFPETTVKGFTEEKKDWVQAYKDKMEEMENILKSASMTDWKKKYAIGNYLLTGKEWDIMIKSIKEMWQKELEEEEQEKEEKEPVEEPEQA